MNQTTNYSLNLPSGEDYYSIEHQNENMRALDTAVFERVGAGRYVGNGEEERTISLPRTPRFVLILREGSRMQDESVHYGGLAVEGAPAVAVGYEYIKLTENGFTLRHLPRIDAFTSLNVNTDGVAYHYLWG